MNESDVSVTHKIVGLIYSVFQDLNTTILQVGVVEQVYKINVIVTIKQGEEKERKEK